VISQPFRPDSSVALPDRTLGDLLGEELRRLDPDEPYSEALEAATGTSGLSGRPPVREYVWLDPAEQNGNGDGTGEGSSGGQAVEPRDGSPDATARNLAPNVPADSQGTDEEAQQGVDDDAGSSGSRTGGKRA
jgi:hypothetical protein